MLAIDDLLDPVDADPILFVLLIVEIIILILFVTEISVTAYA